MATSASLAADGAGFATSSMENSGNASGTAYYMGTAESVDSGAAGKICMIDRGNISFYDKVNNCENSGGIGAVIINNEAGMLYATLGDTNDTTIPAVGAALEDRSALLSSTTIDIAIGTSDYGFMSGTSMATPAVSGIAALVWSNHPECTGTEIRDALKATAQDQGASGHDVYFGHGIVKAADADAYLMANGCAGGNNGGGTTPGSDDISLSTSGYKSKGTAYVDLSWNGAATSTVDVYRNGIKVGSVANTNSYTDTITSKGGGTYTYQVCEAQSTTVCSNNSSVTF